MLGGQQWIADVVAPPSFAVWPTGVLIEWSPTYSGRNYYVRRAYARFKVETVNDLEIRTLSGNCTCSVARQMNEWIAHAVGEWLSERSLTSQSTHNGSFCRWDHETFRAIDRIDSLPTSLLFLPAIRVIRPNFGWWGFRILKKQWKNSPRQNLLYDKISRDKNRMKRRLTNVHSESKKLCYYTFVYNFDKCWPIFKILSLLYHPRNLQQNSCHVAQHT